MQPKTIEAYSLAVRRAGEYFEYQIDALTEQQLTGYFSDLLESHSWSTVKHDLYGLKFYYEHVLHQPWAAPGLVKPPRVQQLPDIVTVAQARQIFAATRVLSYRVFFCTLLQHGAASRRRAAAATRRHRRRARARACPRREGQQGSLRALAGGHRPG